MRANTRDADAERDRLSPRELWTVGLLGLISLFLMADQQLLAPNLTRIAQELGLSELERDQKLGGDIALVFWLLGGAISVGVGYLTDRLRRRTLFVAVVLVGELPCLLTGFARSYEDLFWLRALTGIGMGGAIPIVYSLLGDLFSARRRATATAVLGFGMGLGVALGQLTAGLVGPSHGWRLPFVLVAAPNFVLAMIFWLTTREPVRGQREAQRTREVAQPPLRARLAHYRQIFRVRTNLLVFLQGIPGTVPWGVFFVFLADFYAQDKGYSVESATLVVMALALAALLGGLLGGFLGQAAYDRSPRAMPLLCAVSTLVGIGPTLLLLNHPSQVGVEDPALATPIALAILTGLTISITGANLRAMLLNVNDPRTRGSVFALYNLADDLGKGLGPAVIALLITAFGRSLAFNLAVAGWGVCAAVLLLLVRQFPADERALAGRSAAPEGASEPGPLGLGVTPAPMGAVHPLSERGGHS